MADISTAGEGRWTNYILGVVDQIKKNDYHLADFKIVVGGDIPISAGLSSSVAIECAVIYELKELFQPGIEKLVILLMQIIRN